MRVAAATMAMRGMVVVSERHTMHFMVVRWRGLLRVRGCAFPRFCMRGSTFHRDSRERLNRKAQCQQDDDEEFAPVRHGSGV
ncbi:hypothetical protein WK80_10530 [Burkholderia multivorans]|nr:hypothetical protein WK80_10530 [Burkholderia multivorans]